MKKLFLILLFLGGCATKTSPPRNVGVIPPTPQAHPEHPLVASPLTSAWEIALWLALIIFVICVSPNISRAIWERWPSLKGWIRKLLTKR